MVILVTGATGFAGGHLVEALLQQSGAKIFGVSRGGRWPTCLQHLRNYVTLLPCDLTDPADIAGIVKTVEPQWIYHLAGFANVARAESSSASAWANNVTATRNLYEAVRSWGGTCRILYVGSGLVYAESNDNNVPDEQSPLRGRSVYAASKCAADQLSEEFGRTHGLHIVRARPLNHIGPRQSAEFAVASFARQIAAIEQGQQPPWIEVGNLSALRDLTDVRDVVQAYIAMLRGGRPGQAYNVATGQLRSIQSMLEQLLSLSNVQVEVRRLERLMRAGDPAVLRACSAKLRRETGWVPRYSLEDTLRDTLNYWRASTMGSPFARGGITSISLETIP